MRLTLEDLFFDGADGEQPIDEAPLLLAVSPHPGHGLLVVGRVPV